MRGALSLLGGATFVLAAWSCSLTVDLPEPGEALPGEGGGGAGGAPIGGDGGDGGMVLPPCATGTKRCGDDCVPIDQAVTGCAADSCDPCALANAASICVAGSCAISVCVNGFEDCDWEPSNGCEVNVETNPLHCKGCGNQCLYQNAGATCVNGQCAMGTCVAGYSDCDTQVDTGCEENTAYNPDACNDCTTICPDSGGTATCNMGTCGVSSCTDPSADCDFDGIDCETNIDTSSLHCGFCNNPCALTNAVASCQGGNCTLDSCVANKGNCDSNDSNGCETDLLINATHCGGCGHSCLGGACVNGDCQPFGLGDGAIGQIALDATHAYYGAQDGVMRVPLAGGLVEPVVSGTGPVEGIALRDGLVFFAGKGSPPNARLFSAPQTGGPPDIVAAGLGNTVIVRADATYTYFTGSSGGDEGAYRVAKAGGTPELLLQGQSPSGLALTDTGIALTVKVSSGAVLLSDGGSLITDAENPTDIVRFGDELFWTTTHKDHPVQSASIIGSGLKTLTSGISNSLFLAVDADNVYWTTQDLGLFRVKAAGGSPELVHNGGFPMHSIALDNDAVYFINADTSTLMKIAKP